MCIGEGRCVKDVRKEAWIRWSVLFQGPIISFLGFELKSERRSQVFVSFPS